jgi:hypothetical protein
VELSEAKPVLTDEGVTFTPWTNGYAVGFRVTRKQDGRVEYVLLNPSSGHDRPDFDGRGDVFVYHAADVPDGVDPMDDWGSPVVFVEVFEPVPDEWAYDSAYRTHEECWARIEQLSAARPDAAVEARTSDSGLFEVWIRGGQR